MTEVAILIGLQASGKTTFYRQVLAATHEHVSKDAFRHARNRQRRQMQLINEALKVGRNVAVDNANPSPEEWQPVVALAHHHGAKVIGYWFALDVEGSLRRNASRAGRDRVPDVGVFATLKRLRRPHRAEGFDELFEVRFDGHGGFTAIPLAQN